MIETSDKSDINKIKEPDTSEFKDIKSDGILSKSEADEYWQGVFNNKSEDSEIFLNENELWEKTRDCSEDDFDFNFELNDEIKDVLKNFETDNWEALNKAEKETIVEKLAQAIGKELEVEELPDIEFFEDAKENCGCYNEWQNVVSINSNNFDDPKEVINTVAHEIRHSYQNMRADKLETEQDELYKYSFDNYISPKYDNNGYCLNFFEYQDQLVEAEARAFANLFTNTEVA